MSDFKMPGTHSYKVSLSCLVEDKGKRKLLSIFISLLLSLMGEKSAFGFPRWVWNCLRGMLNVASRILALPSSSFPGLELKLRSCASLEKKKKMVLLRISFPQGTSKFSVGELGLGFVWTGVLFHTFHYEI